MIKGDKQPFERERTLHSDGPLFNLLKLLLLVAVLSAAGFFLVTRLLALLPPEDMRLAAGRTGGAYHALAEQYRDFLARDGIKVEIVETAGSVENVTQLTAIEPRADAAFLQGGVPLPESSGVEALAAIFLEPLWVFHNGAISNPVDPTAWAGLRVAAGEEGSGTRFVFDAVARSIGSSFAGAHILALGGEQAAGALLSSEVDIALFVAPVTAPYLEDLFADSGITAGEIRDGQALSRQLPYVQMADIPRAGFDYSAVRPPARIDLIAMVGRLVVQPDLHPALVDRLVMAARHIHSGRDLITEENEFPSSDILDMPVNAQAINLLSGPPSPLHRFLPYWVVAQINSFALLLLPFIVILIPLTRILPGLYQWRMRSRVYRHYPLILDIERQSYSVSDPAKLDLLERQLVDMENELVALRLPVQFREYAYTMRVHIELVRRRLAVRREEIVKTVG